MYLRNMNYFAFIIWILVFVQCQEESGRQASLLSMWTMLRESLLAFINQIDVKQSAFAPYRMTPRRIRSSGETVRTARHDVARPKGWLWCSENSTFALKPCPGDPPLEECLTQTNVTREEVGQLMKGIWRLNPHKSIKKWALCYLSKNGVMSPDGVLRQGVVLKNIPHYDKPIVEKTIDKCLYKSAHDPAETAWHYLTCFRTKLPKYAIIANGL